MTRRHSWTRLDAVAEKGCKVSVPFLAPTPPLYPAQLRPLQIMPDTPSEKDAEIRTPYLRAASGVLERLDRIEQLLADILARLDHIDREVATGDFR